MGVILGMKCKLFYGAAGEKVTASGTEMKNVKDLTINLETGEADVTTRANNGWRATVGTLKEASIEFGMLYDPEDVDFNAVQEAFLGNKPMGFFVSDGVGNGLSCDVMITNFSQDQNLEEGVNVSVTAKPTASKLAPSWVPASGEKTVNA